MSLMRMMFSGEVKKVEHRQAAGKPLIEASICKKNRLREGEEESYTWLNLTIWGPFPDWMLPRMVKGAMIAGIGEFTLRSYVKDGVKQKSADVNCQSFDVEVSDESPRQSATVQHEPTQRAEPKVVNKMTQATRDAVQGMGSSEPPFQRHEDRSW